MAKIRTRETVIIDTGIVYALADRKDRWHKASADFVNRFTGRLLIPCSVIPEACYLLNTYLGCRVEKAFIRSLIEREMVPEHISQADLERSHEILEVYADTNIGFVDASIVAVSERLNIQTILTTDRRHFSLVRPKHCDSYQLLPASAG